MTQQFSTEKMSNEPPSYFTFTVLSEMEKELTSVQKELDSKESKRILINYINFEM